MSTQASHPSPRAATHPWLRRLKRWLRFVHPDRASANQLNETGVHFAERGDLRVALETFERALDANPRHAEAWVNLGTCLYILDRPDDACIAYARAEKNGEASAELYDNWGNALAKTARLSAAIEKHERALEIDPALAGVESNLGVTLGEMGRPKEACARTSAAWAKHPDDQLLASTALFRSHFSTELTAAEIAAGHRRWPGASIARSGRHVRDADPERVLRVGYVSSDFRVHSCACFLLPLIRAHHEESVEVYAYHAAHTRDEVTAAFQRVADHWRECATLSDEDLAGLIEEDRIDILVDCGGHTAGNRLSAFLFAPAPVQVSWLGYPFSTGLSVMDARLSDIVADPKGESDSLHSESVLRLPGGYHTYRPLVETPEPLARDTASSGIRFAAFHNLAKFSSVSVALWASVVKSTPGSCLVLKARGLSDRDVREEIIQRFCASGVDRQAIDVLPWRSGYGSHYEDLNSVDIVLDAVPYNGTTTTCEALWMGVPVVTRSGDRSSARVGASLLTQIGREDWISYSDEDFIRIASRLASDTEHLQNLRNTLRLDLSRSTLGDPGLFARSIESGFRKLWQDWCRNAERP